MLEKHGHPGRDGETMMALTEKQKMRLFDLIEDLHCSISGSGEYLGWGDGEREIVDFLREKLNRWEKSIHHQKYDDCVKALIEAVISEWESSAMREFYELKTGVDANDEKA